MDGDRNKKYFHTKTIIRRKRNKIIKLRSQDGIWIVFIPWVELSDPGCSTGKATDLFRSGQPDLSSKSSAKSQESPNKGPE